MRWRPSSPSASRGSRERSRDPPAVGSRARHGTRRTLPSISVVLSTYNAPDELERTLLGYSAQTYGEFEVVVADDGSGPKTRDRIAQVRASTSLTIFHVWQRDDGFRKCRILNRAIAQARGDVLVLSDGDCVPREDFVEAHARLARRGHFVSGGRVRLAREIGSRIAGDDVLNGSLFDESWLRERSALVRRRDRRKLTRLPRRAMWLDRLTTTRATWNGHNASAWKTDLLRVNGFDERMTYPVEDRELGERLRNAGVRPIQARHRAVCAHVEHDRPWRDPEAQARNKRLRAETRGVPPPLRILPSLSRGRDWTEHGIQKGPRSPDSVGRGAHM